MKIAKKDVFIFLQNVTYYVSLLHNFIGWRKPYERRKKGSYSRDGRAYM